MNAEKEMKELGIFPYFKKELTDYYLDDDIKLEMITLSKKKKRFSYLELINE